MPTLGKNRTCSNRERSFICYSLQRSEEFFDRINHVVRWYDFAVYEILSKLPRHGVGVRVQRKAWKEDSFWDVVETKMHLSGKSGKAYGKLTWRGSEMHNEPKRMNGTLKKVWRLVPQMAEESKEWPSLPQDNLDSLLQKGEGSKQDDTVSEESPQIQKEEDTINKV